MKDYARRGGFDVQPPPWACDSAQATVLTMPAEREALQALCDRTLNLPSGNALCYRPVVDLVVLTFQRLNRLRSLSPHASQPVDHTYNEVSFWVLVRDDNDPEAGAELLVPYIFADNSVAVAAGRESYGYPKEFAAIGLPDEQSPGSVRALVARSLAAGEAAAPNVELINATFQDLLALELDELANVVFDALDLVTTEGMAKATMSVLRFVFEGRLDFVFLRQIRAAGGGPGCDLQQVVRARADLGDFDGPELKGLYHLSFAPCASHPIVSDLGLTLGEGGMVAAIGATINFPFVLNPGTIAWP